MMMRRVSGFAFSTVFPLLWVMAAAWVHRQSRPHGPKVPCFFIFGDSLVDNGNNNAMLTLARANYLPYGVDLPQGITGRFTNGRTHVDALAQLLGFKDYIPPYVTTSGEALLKGVNYASGGAGIRDETGNNLGDHTPMSQQVAKFAGSVTEMTTSLFEGDRDAVTRHLSKCIFYSGIGSNDYLNNYFMPVYYSTSSSFTPKAYAAALLRDYARQLRELYKLGARKIVVTGVGTIGCIPYELARYEGGRSRCNESINSAILLFNSGLRKLVCGCNKGQLPGAKFVYLDAFQGSKHLVSNAKIYGVVEQGITRRGMIFVLQDSRRESGCCGVGKNNGLITCLPLQQPCPEHNKYLFWDAFHPTESANLILANMSYYTTSPSYAYPINIRQLAKL